MHCAQWQSDRLCNSTIYPEWYRIIHAVIASCHPLQHVTVYLRPRFLYPLYATRWLLHCLRVGSVVAILVLFAHLRLVSSVCSRLLPLLYYRRRDECSSFAHYVHFRPRPHWLLWIHESWSQFTGHPTEVSPSLKWAGHRLSAEHPYWCFIFAALCTKHLSLCWYASFWPSYLHAPLHVYSIE